MKNNGKDVRIVADAHCTSGAVLDVLYILTHLIFPTAL